MKRSPLFNKLAVIAGVALLLAPLGMVEYKIAERQSRQHEVQREIASSASSEQTLSGPYLAVTYQMREQVREKLSDGGTRTVNRLSDLKTALIPARDLHIDGKADVEIRSRGIYKARLYKLTAGISGEFRLPRNYGLPGNAQDIVPQGAYLVMNLSDLRGMLNSPKATVDGKQYEFEPGNVGSHAGNGMHVVLPKFALAEEHSIKFDFPLELQGMGRLAVQPSGDNTEVTLESSWPHPSFGGSYLPRTRSVDASGFKARWQVPRLARNSNPAAIVGAHSDGVFAVSFIDPVDVYLLSERSVKYGLLFVVLTFTAFFLFELTQRLRIHPMQYLLVGLALAMFFLLLISLSEHAPFALAYLASGGACVMLIGVYLGGVMRSPKAALLFSGGLSALYGMLYVVLQSEDNALLMGSVVMFGALAAAMLLTRRLDWYALGEEEAL